MGNTPSSQHGSPPRAGGHVHPGSRSASGGGPGRSSSPTTRTSGPSAPDHPVRPSPSSRNPSLRLPMPARTGHISPSSSNPTSPSAGRSNSPRRRKSLELPDLNKLSFTPAAPVPTTATHTGHHHPSLDPQADTRLSEDLVREPASAAPGASGSGSSGRKWRAALGGRANPLGGKLGMSSTLESGVPHSAPVAMSGASVSPSRAADAGINPYFPANPHAAAEAAEGVKRRPTISTPIPIPKKAKEEPAKAAVPEKVQAPAEPNVAAVGAPGEMSEDGLVNVPIQWTGGGKVVYVTGNFADNWKGRIKLKRSTHDFNTILRLPPGQYRLKFIVDDSWRCSKQISTATDDDGTLVNWIEVESPKTADELKAEFDVSTMLIGKEEEPDESVWTDEIPAPLVLYQYLEELPHLAREDGWRQHLSKQAYLSRVPPPPVLPRILDKVIVNAETKSQVEASKARSFGGYGGGAQQIGMDDNSILAVPNHVVLNHLTASAIKNGTLGVGTTTRYRKKYITTMFFKPTLADLQSDLPVPAGGPPGVEPATQSGAGTPSEPGAVTPEPAEVAS